MKKMFPDYSENIVNDDEMKSIFNVLTTAGEQGYNNVNIIDFYIQLYNIIV